MAYYFFCVYAYPQKTNNRLLPSFYVRLHMLDALPSTTRLGQWLTGLPIRDVSGITTTSGALTLVMTFAAEVVAAGVRRFVLKVTPEMYSYREQISNSLG